jgi:Ca2+/Na+ antiporter
MLSAAVEVDLEDLGHGLWIFLVLFYSAIAGAACLVTGLGCWFASRAVRGSTFARVGLLVLGSIEFVAQIFALPPVFEGTFTVLNLLPAAALVAQATVYLIASRRNGTDPSQPDHLPA